LPGRASGPTKGRFIFARKVSRVLRISYGSLAERLRLAAFDESVNANALALYVLLIIVAGCILVLVWIFWHLAQETRRRR
jgi:hypothetical protein